jgi:uncharacterized integral membrane protein
MLNRIYLPEVSLVVGIIAMLLTLGFVVQNTAHVSNQDVHSQE